MFSVAKEQDQYRFTYNEAVVIIHSSRHTHFLDSSRQSRVLLLLTYLILLSTRVIHFGLIDEDVTHLSATNVSSGLHTLCVRIRTTKYSEII